MTVPSASFAVQLVFSDQVTMALSHSIRTDSTIIHVTEFLTGRQYDLDSGTVDDGSILSRHGGGDFGIMDAFVRALETNDRSHILSGVDETLESHLMVFAAEESRRTGKVIEVR